eukprot:jgi/Mesvir1/13760/Mv22701-RA.1
MKVVISPDGTKILTSKQCTLGGIRSRGAGGVRVRRFRVDPAAFRYILNSMAEGKELGGNFRVDARSSVLKKAAVTNVGRSNDVDTPHGIVEWHTHPQGCTLRDCSLPSPSDTDVGVFLEDALTDNVAHLRQFSDLQRAFAVRYHSSRDEREKDYWEAWHGREWMRLAPSCGLSVSFFPPGVPPVLDIHVRCAGK